MITDKILQAFSLYFGYLTVAPMITDKILQAFSLYFGYCKRSKTGGIEGLRPQLPSWFSKIIIIDMFHTI